ncbi:MAG: fimbrillin family protein [Bacteroidaceae bacterium]|nr:fimbrillin family protein [Bacteroidaceae bacterium]
MKNTLCIFVALLFAACTHDEPLEHNPELALMFQPSMYMHVADDNVEGFSEEMSFAVRAWSLPRAEEWNLSSAKATEFLPLSVASCKKANIAKNSSGGNVTGKLWTLGENVLWPSTSERLTFMAYSPVAADCTCDPVSGVTCTMDVSTEQTDLLYTLPCRDREKLKDSGIVPLTFDHALCRIDLRVTHRVSADEKITIKRITLDEAQYKGTFASLHDPQWTLEESSTAFTLFEGTQEAGSTPAAIGRYIFLPPQKLATPITVEFEYTTAFETTIPLTLKTVAMGTELKAGRTYTYTLSVGVDDVKFLQEIIRN